MAEQIREQRQSRRIRRHSQNFNLAEGQEAGAEGAAVRQNLSRFEAAVNEYLTDTSAADNAANVGRPQEHAQVRPLSDEALINGFRQTVGE